MTYPRIMIAAPKSGSGKTVITIALMKALSMRGKKVNAFKCGPDYIDPMFHQRVLNLPSKNLDLFFTSEEMTRSLFALDNEGDISVIEGVMGLYDGLGGISEEASSYHLAKTLACPIILVIDAKGMARSILAEIKGFLSMDTEGLIQGLILNHMSGMFYESIKKLIEEETKIKVLGYFPDQKELALESRYLGLKLPGEIADLEENAKKAALALEDSVDIAAAIEIAEKAKELDLTKEIKVSLESNFKEKPETVRIAVARDEAFCFYYEDNLRMLEGMGAELIYFSPIHDRILPKDCCGLILGGGYPELLAFELSQNTTMLASIRGTLQNKLPVIAECGGFMYLHEYMEDANGNLHQMVGRVDGKVTNQGKLGRFGYITIEEKADKCWGGTIRGHEFHYFDSSNNGSDCLAVKPVNGRSWDCVHKSQTAWMGYPHLYFPSNPDFPKAFVAKCFEYKEKSCH